VGAGERARRELLASGDAYPPGEALAFHERLAGGMAGRPGVSRAAVASHVPGASFATVRRVQVEGEAYASPSDAPLAQVVYVSPGFFETLGSRVERGRDLTWRDGGEEPLAAVVNHAFAERVLGGRDPLGVRLRLTDGEQPWATIVGVVPALGVDRDLANGGSRHTADRPRR
jgi:hypothetical protein